MFSSFITSASALAMLQVATAAPTVVGRDSVTAVKPIPGYNIVDLTWEVETTPGGPSINVTGTVQQVVERLTEVNSNYVSDFGLDKPVEDVDLLMGALYDQKNIFCSVPFGYYFVIDIEEGIKYLRKVSGTPRNGPGPGNCGRVSCSWGNAVYRCNDNIFSKSLTRFGAIVDGAQRILDQCRLSALNYFHGQVHFTDGWNVLVRQDNTC